MLHAGGEQVWLTAPPPRVAACWQCQLVPTEHRHLGFCKKSISSPSSTRTGARRPAPRCLWPHQPVLRGAQRAPASASCLDQPCPGRQSQEGPEWPRTLSQSHGGGVSLQDAPGGLPRPRDQTALPSQMPEQPNWASCSREPSAPPAGAPEGTGWTEAWGPGPAPQHCWAESGQTWPTGGTRRRGFCQGAPHWPQTVNRDSTQAEGRELLGWLFGYMLWGCTPDTAPRKPLCSQRASLNMRKGRLSPEPAAGTEASGPHGICPGPGLAGGHQAQGGGRGQARSPT